MSALNPILVDLPMPILTPRLLIRDCRPGDGAELFAARKESDAELRPWMPWARGTSPTLEECEANVREAHARFILRENLRLIAIDRESGRLIASSGLHQPDFKNGIFEIGYWVRTPVAGRGYVTEAVNTITRYAFDRLGPGGFRFDATPGTARAGPSPSGSASSSKRNSRTRIKRAIGRSNAGIF